jgi:1-Cys peroxiredoxin
MTDDHTRRRVNQRQDVRLLRHYYPCATDIAPDAGENPSRPISRSSRTSTDAHGVATPAHWRVGDEVIIPAVDHG